MPPLFMRSLPSSVCFKRRERDCWFVSLPFLNIVIDSQRRFIKNQAVRGEFMQWSEPECSDPPVNSLCAKS